MRAVPFHAGPDLWRRRIRTRRLIGIVLASTVAALVIAVPDLADTDSASQTIPPSAAPAAVGVQSSPRSSDRGQPQPLTRPGSDPSVLPGKVLIADKANN